MNPRLAVSQGLLLCTGGKGNALCAHLCAPIRDLALFSGCVFPRYCESPLQYVIARLCFNTSFRGSARAVAIFNRRSLGDCHASLAMTGKDKGRHSRSAESSTVSQIRTRKHFREGLSVIQASFPDGTGQSEGSIRNLGLFPGRESISEGICPEKCRVLHVRPYTPFHEDGTGASIVRGSFFTGWVKVMRRA